MRLGSIRILICLTVLLLIVPASYSQLVRPRVGVGMGVVGSTGANPFGLGLDTRLAFPINADLSISAGASFVNYVFQGRDGAAYFISPSISLIVTMNTAAPRSPYLVAGLGAYLPLAGDTEKDESGPIVEAGIGWVFGLQATSVYLEITPALVVARSAWICRSLFVLALFYSLIAIRWTALGNNPPMFGIPSPRRPHNCTR